MVDKNHSTPSPNATPQRVALVSPFSNSTNSYIELQKCLLHELGFGVKPLSIKTMLNGAWRDFGCADNVLLFHWLETRAFRRQGAGVKLSVRGLLEFLAYVVIMKAAKARSVYFVHNHGVHDGTKWQTEVSQRLIAFAAKSAQTRVVHDPCHASTYHANYLPHPIYWDTPIARHVQSTSSKGQERPIFGILGAVRPYKAIDEVIQVWPDGYTLVVRGHGDHAYLQHLDQLRRRRATDDISIEGRFLSPSEFDAALDEVDVLVIPQLPGSMLVSGAFFEGIGRVKAIIARKSPFISWACENLPGVFAFDSLSELQQVVVRVQQHLATAREAPAEGAKVMFGWKACLASYAQLLNAQ